MIFLLLKFSGLCTSPGRHIKILKPKSTCDNNVTRLHNNNIISKQELEIWWSWPTFYQRYRFAKLRNYIIMVSSVPEEGYLMGHVYECQEAHRLGRTCFKRDINYQLFHISRTPSFEKEVKKKIPSWRER